MLMYLHGGSLCSIFLPRSLLVLTTTTTTIELLSSPPLFAVFVALPWWLSLLFCFFPSPMSSWLAVVEAGRSDLDKSSLGVRGRLLLADDSSMADQPVVLGLRC